MIRATLARASLSLLLAAAANSAVAQFNPNPTRHIGDAAPPIKVQAWVRGDPVTAFEPGKVYVLDFWATWCGGCIISFPHISGIAAKYKDRVTFVSVDSNEEVARPSATIDSVAEVTTFLKKPEGQALKLNVAVDGPSHSMWNSWIEGLHRAGLPTTFVIDQEGKIAWIDVNLDHLEWVLDDVLAKKWDRTRAAAAQKERDAAEDTLMKWSMSKPDGKKAAAQTLLDLSLKFEQHFPERKSSVETYKFLALLDLDRSKLAAHLNQIATDPHPRYLDMNDTAGLTLREKDLSKETYAAAAKVLERCLSNEFPAVNTCGKTTTTYAELADAYNRAGDRQRAVSAQEKALGLANEAKAPADQIEKLRTDLDHYRGSLKSS